jgi:DNA polymerase I-like protein with 3'-5' exonuclease and polymerase domains
MGLLESYCGQDCEVTAKLYLNLVNELNEKQFSEESVLLEHEVALIIEEQVRNGFKLDIPYATCLLVTIKGKLDALYEQLQQRWPPVVVKRTSDKTGKPLKDGVATFNPASRKQIGEKLIELGWKPDKHTETGQPIVDEGVLSKIDLPEAAPIVEYLMLQKRVAQIESWLEAVGKDGRVHGKVITNGAITARMTHSSPNMSQTPNASALYGKECRECWIAEEGNVLVGCDLSGIELRCLSHYMKDAAWQKELLEGDIHWKNTQAFGLVPLGTVKTDSKEHKDLRNISKTLTYSVLYGAGAAKVGSTMGGSSKIGNKLINSFLKNTPSLAKLKEKVSKYATIGYVPALDGRKVWIRSDHAALNSLLQSAGAIIAKQWLCVIRDDLKEAGIWYKQVLFSHDEIQIETKPETAEKVGIIVAEAARKAGRMLNLRCPVEAEYKIAKDWYGTH